MVDVFFKLCRTFRLECHCHAPFEKHEPFPRTSKPGLVPLPYQETEKDSGLRSRTDSHQAHECSGVSVFQSWFEQFIHSKLLTLFFLFNISEHWGRFCCLLLVASQTTVTHCERQRLPLLPTLFRIHIPKPNQKETCLPKYTTVFTSIAQHQCGSPLTPAKATSTLL